MMKWLNILLFLMVFTKITAQQNLNKEAAIQLAWQQNQQLKVVGLEVDAQKLMLRAAKEIPKSQVELQYGRTQMVGFNDLTFGFSQQFAHPYYYKAVANYMQKQVEAVMEQQAIKKNELAFQISDVYTKYAYFQALEKLLSQQDSLFQLVQKAATIRHSTGETALLEKVSSEARTTENLSHLQSIFYEKKQLRETLALLLNDKTEYNPEIHPLNNRPLLLNDLNVKENPFLQYLAKQNSVAESQVQVEKARLRPDYKLGFLSQSIEHQWNQMVLQAGIGIPIFAKANKARISSSQVYEKVAQEKYLVFENELKTRLAVILENQQKVEKLLFYYEQTAVPQGELITKMAWKQYQSGEISYTEYVQASQQAWQIKQWYLEKLLEYHQILNEIRYVTGNSF